MSNFFMGKSHRVAFMVALGLFLLSGFIYLVYDNPIFAAIDSQEICDNNVDDNGDGTVDGCWDPGANYQPTGRIYYVATNGVDSDDGSESRPFKTFAKATSLAKYHPETNKSDAIYVKSGTYSETIQMQYAGTPDRPLVVRGVGVTRPVIRVGGVNNAHIVPKSNTIIENMKTDGIQTVTSRGHGLGGYGIYLSSSDNVRNVLIKGCEMTQHEKAIRAEGVDPRNASKVADRLIVRDSLLKNNEWATYIGTDNESGPVPEFKNTLWENVEAADSAYRDYHNTDGFLIEGSTAHHVFRNCISHGWTDAGFDIKSHVLIENSIAYDNSWVNGDDENGHGFKIWRDGIIRNSIAYNNKLANFIFGGLLPDYKMVGSISYNGKVTFEDRPGQSSSGLSAQSVKISHNIFYNSDITDEIGHVTGVSALEFADHNLFFGSGIPSDKGENAIEADPRFMNISTKDFHITSGSPVIDAGSSVITSFMSRADKDNRNRKAGSAVDIGPYEFNSGLAPEGTATPNPTAISTQGSGSAATMIPTSVATNSPTNAEDGDLLSTFRFQDILDQPAKVNQKLSFNMRTLGETGAVRIRATKIPEGATFTNNKFSWTPRSNQSGSYSAVFEASDGSGSYTSRQVNIKVTRGVSILETRWLYPSISQKTVSFQVCRRSTYSERFREVITFGDGSQYLVINEPARSACTNYYTHQYEPGNYLMTLYLCRDDSLNQCFPNRVERITITE